MGVGNLDSVGIHDTRSSGLGFPAGMYRRDGGGSFTVRLCRGGAAEVKGRKRRGKRIRERDRVSGERVELCPLFFFFMFPYLA